MQQSSCGGDPVNALAAHGFRNRAVQGNSQVKLWQKLKSSGNYSVDVEECQKSVKQHFVPRSVNKKK